MNRTLVVFLGLVGLTVLCSSSVYAASSAKVTARVVDDNGVPIQGADVTVGYTLAKKGGIGTDDYRKKGKSDKEGLFTATGETIIPQVTIHAQVDGYYKSSKWAKFTSRSKLRNRWEPWNPTVEVVLKKKRNPVSMYDNHRTSYKIPKLDTPIGFDLEKEDWVTPYGKGAISDFVITFNAEIRAYTDYECGFTLTFTNTHDGIQEYLFDNDDPSYFKWPFEAPSNKYLSKISKQKNMSPAEGYRSDEKDKINYIFRVRTEVDKDGNIVKANYGKLSGEFGFVPKRKITFRYYFNPDGTRNLEEDPKKNLFKKK